MKTKAISIEDYITLLQQLAADLPSREKYYVFMDDELMEMESELCEGDIADEFYTRIVEIYRSWQSSMDEAEWNKLEKYNDRLPGAQKNWLIGDQLVWGPTE